MGRFFSAVTRKVSPLQLVLILLVLGGAVWYISGTIKPASTTQWAYVEIGTVGAVYDGDALIVRNESPYYADGVTNINYIAEEGAWVEENKGQVVCEVFSSGFSTKEISALQGYRENIRDYEITLINDETTYDASLTRVEADVLARASEARSIIFGTAGNLSNQEALLKTAISERQKYIKGKYGSDQRLQRLLEDEQQQMQRIQSWTKQVAPTRKGIVSFYTDGYELGLSFSTYDTFTPADVRRMIGGALPENTTVSRGKTCVFRIIMSEDEWYMLMLVDDKNWNPNKGDTFNLLLEDDDEPETLATIEDMNRSDGELLLKLSVKGDVRKIMYMRTCRAHLSSTIQTLKVPSRAIYEQNGMRGVVVEKYYGDEPFFIPVTIEREEDNYVYIVAVTDDQLQEGMVVRLF